VAVQASALSFKNLFSTPDVAQGDGLVGTRRSHGSQIGHQRRDLMFVKTSGGHCGARDTVLNHLPQFFVGFRVTELSTRELDTRHCVAFRPMTAGAVLYKELFPFLSIGGRVAVLRRE
jgi:hypothetical protein